MKNLIDQFIAWAVRRAPHEQPVVTFDGRPLFTRFEFLWPDEWPDSFWDRHRERYPRRPGALPWWRPFNAMLHRWDVAGGVPESFHDHPRWSVTICLKGGIIERTPWGDRLLKPGSIVIRSRKAIHAFAAPEGASEPTWTLFIVGRRRYRQNSYAVTPR